MMEETISQLDIISYKINPIETAMSYILLSC